MRLIALALVGLCLALPAAAKEKDKAPLALDDLFRDHMVLPRHAGVVAGLTAPNGTVTISFYNFSQQATADETGRFRLTLPDFEPGKTGSLSVAGDDGNRLEIADVVAGDVYLCSGQSNMGLPVDHALNSD